MNESTLPLPQPASNEDKLRAFDSVPLFMRSLPGDDADDAAVSALQSLAHEGTPDEVAENFKEQGNEYYKGKRYTEARNFYTQGIDAKPTDPILLGALLCNRAACNLELKNYGFVLRDCSRAISLNSRSSKAHYRSALALTSLERFEEALDCCDRCLEFDPSNTGVRELRERSRKGKEAYDIKEMARKERLQRETALRRQLDMGLKARSIIPIEGSPANSANTPCAPHFVIHPQSSELTLVVPVIFLYPQYQMSDLISDFDEGTTFDSHLDAMFPSSVSEDMGLRPEWDKNGEYISTTLVVYSVTHKRRLLKVGRKMTLLDVWKAVKSTKGDGIELKDGCMSVVVLPKGKIEGQWVEDFKAGRNP